MCRQGLRKTHERSDPACRFHGSDARGNLAVSRGETARATGHAAPGDGDGEEPTRPRHVPFEQMTMFETKGGISLHYLPGPLDIWISNEVVNQAGEWYDSQAERPLTEAETRPYEQYRQRLATRCQTERAADRLAKIVDRYLPEVSQETRSYMIRFPHEIKRLLAKARRIRRKMKARTRPPAPASHGGKNRTASSRPETKAKQRSGERAGDAKRESQPSARDAATANEDSQDEVVDRGSAEATGSKQQLAATGTSGNAAQAKENDGHPDEGEELYSETRGEPRTPSRSPRRRPTQPSEQAVQRVQEHMRACRLRRSQMRTH